MKYILTTIIALMIAGASYTQSLYTMNYTMSFGVGETAKFIGSPSFRGITFEGRGFVTDNVSLGGLFTWSTFYEKLANESYTSGTTTLTGTQYRYINAFPILFQAHYYIGTDSYAPRVYLGGGVGTYKMVQRLNVGVWSLEDNYWHFGFSPEVGVIYPVSMSTHFNISARYHYVVKAKETIDYSWFGLSVGFAWGD